MAVVFRRFMGHRGANAAIEFALVLPVMLMFMAGIVEIGRAFQVYSSVDRLATRYAVAWADCSDTPTGTCQTEMASYTSSYAMKNMVPQLTNTITLRMLEVSIASGVATVIYATPAGATLTTAELATAQTAIANGQTGVVVTVNYTHTLVFFARLMAPFLGPSRSIVYTVAQLKS